MDTFSYDMMDTDSNVDSATVTINVSDMIWFVSESYGPGGDGTLATPFNNLTSSGSSFDVNATDGPGDAIFLGVGSSYTGGLTLLDGQYLIGDGSSSDLATITGITLPPFSFPLPTFSGTDPQILSSSNGINLSANNTIRWTNG